MARRTLFSLALALLISATGGAAMSNGKMFICSPMDGRLVDGAGNAVAGAEVTREWRYQGERDFETVTTDANGRFAFGAVEAKKSLINTLPTKIAITQRFTTTAMDGARFMAISSRSLDLNHETGGTQAFSVTCDISREPSTDGFQKSNCILNPT